MANGASARDLLASSGAIAASHVPHSTWRQECVFLQRATTAEAGAPQLPVESCTVALAGKPGGDGGQAVRRGAEDHGRQTGTSAAARKASAVEITKEQGAVARAASAGSEACRADRGPG